MAFGGVLVVERGSGCIYSISLVMPRPRGAEAPVTWRSQSKHSFPVQRYGLVLR